MTDLITTSYKNYNKVLDKAMINLGLDVYLTLKPVEQITTTGNTTVVESYLQCCYTDDTSGYAYDFILHREDLAQLTRLLQGINTQLSNTATDGTASTGCSRQVVIK